LNKKNGVLKITREVQGQGSKVGVQDWLPPSAEGMEVRATEEKCHENKKQGGNMTFNRDHTGGSDD